MKETGVPISTAPEGQKEFHPAAAGGSHSRWKNHKPRRRRLCSLPSDHLTPAQLHALNGPLEQVNLYAPITYQELQALPDTLKKAYLQHLRESYRASDCMIGGMLGVSSMTVNRMRSQLGIPAFAKKRPRLSNEDLEKWDRFLSGGETAAETSGDPEPAEATAEAKTIPGDRDTIAGPENSPGARGTGEPGMPDALETEDSEERISRATAVTISAATWKELALKLAEKLHGCESGRAPAAETALVAGEAAIGLPSPAAAKPRNLVAEYTGISGWDALFAALRDLPAPGPKDVVRISWNGGAGD